MAFDIKIDLIKVKGVEGKGNRWIKKEEKYGVVVFKFG